MNMHCSPTCAAGGVVSVSGGLLHVLPLYAGRHRGHHRAHRPPEGAACLDTAGRGGGSGGRDGERHQDCRLLVRGGGADGR
jgi:hypothetical protein